MTRLVLGRQTCGALEEASAREWLVTDGCGGYAMGTVAGLRTRRYHGLLVSAVDRSGTRRLGLAALDPVLVVGDRRVRLATHEWGDGTVAPTGHLLLDRFELEDGVPRWRWSLGSIVLEAEVAMAHGRPAVGVRYRLVDSDGHASIDLEVEALCTWRDVHGARRGEGTPEVEVTADGFVFEHAYRVRGPGFVAGGTWYRNVRYREEAARGLDATEDLWWAGRFVTPLERGRPVELEAWSGALTEAPPPAGQLVAAARHRALAAARRARATTEAEALLAHAADQLVVTSGSTPTVVAGYPWFGEWSRDTMTSYEGLFLETGREEEGRRLLLAAAESVSEGMLANTADVGGTEYNTVDASLWFLHAVGRHIERTGDRDLAAALLDTLAGVVEHHRSGTRFGIRVDGDGLVTWGADGVALTWMDARVDGVPVTPRRGKPVEVNALWCRGLRVVVVAAAGAGRDHDALVRLEAAAARSFSARFARPDGLGLLDVVDSPLGDDATLRPNQLLAVSLPGSPDEHLDGVLRAVEPLVTSLGLRTLGPDDPRYRGRHRGDPAARDAAYHEGTVWPWLLGPYVDALVRAGRSAQDHLDGLVGHLVEWGLGSVSETADGDPPHGATGSPFQAWSVAETLRASRRAAGSGSGSGSGNGQV